MPPAAFGGANRSPRGKYGLPSKQDRPNRLGLWGHRGGRGVGARGAAVVAVADTARAGDSDRVGVVPAACAVRHAAARPAAASGGWASRQRVLSFYWRSLSIHIETPTKGRGGCSKMTVSPTARLDSRLLGEASVSRRREFCHSAATPSTLSWCINSVGERAVRKMTVSSMARPWGGAGAAAADTGGLTALACSCLDLQFH